MYSNVTMSLPASLVEYINEKAKSEMSSKSDIVRRAILKMKEDDFWNDFLEAKEDVKKGRVYSGNLKKLVAEIN